MLGISGSIRAGSFNTAVLAGLRDAVADKADLEILSLADVPLYNGDLDTASPPPAVATLRARIAEADGIVISSPEYNYGMSGVLKNALDWASRPYGKAPLTGKPVLTMTASPAFTGGARAQAQLNEVLIAIAAQLVLRPQSVIPAVQQKITAGKLTDETTLAFLTAGVDDLLKNIGCAASVLEQDALTDK